MAGADPGCLRGPLRTTGTAQLELWLGQTQDAYEARFAQLEQRLVQATAPHDDRLLKIEQQLSQVIDPQVERLKTIEASLAQTTSRLDELSVSLAALTDDTNTIVAANQALRAEPPAALQHLPLASAPQARPKPPTSAALAQVTGSKTASEPGNKDAGTRTSQRQHKWAINLASYVSRKTASRNMESFREKGIAAEMVPANVRGRTIYRVRLVGFDTMEDARAMAPMVKRKLGLKETWIMAN
jgi:cell division septation protein DedD